MNRIHPLEKLLRRVNLTKDCWNWEGPIDSLKKGGYGIVYDRETGIQRTHRLMWHYCYGGIPKGMWILHTCDNPRCVRPSHLYLGTNKENVRDRVTRGRGAYGIRNGGGVKLNDVKVVEMRQMYATGKFTKAHLSRVFGITDVHVNRIVNGRNWKHIV
jgi:hypothetical protein